MSHKTYIYNDRSRLKGRTGSSRMKNAAQNFQPNQITRTDQDSRTSIYKDFSFLHKKIKNFTLQR
uniref:Uncharacterized protein n=1 Tax=Anguilla anguilla TaxID=7936 RepID=A0A0E9WPF9_ANGAN